MIKNYQDFVSESKVASINEAAEFVNDGKFSSFDELIKHCESKEFHDGLKAELKKIGIGYDVEVGITSGKYVKFKSKDLKSSDLGVFANCFKEVYLSNFGGSDIRYYEKEGYVKELWLGNLNLSAIYWGGGSNGFSYCIGGKEVNIWYNFQDKKFLHTIR